MRPSNLRSDYEKLQLLYESALFFLNFSDMESILIDCNVENSGYSGPKNEKIEEERAALKSDGLTPVTKESFFAWKERRAAAK